MEDYDAGFFEKGWSMTGDRRRTGDREAWVPSANRLVETTLDVSFLNLAVPTDDRRMPDVDLDGLCDGILASLKLPSKDRRK